MQYRPITLEERLQLAECQHEQMETVVGHSVDIGIGVINYDDYVCPDCGFVRAFNSTLTWKEECEAWKSMIIKADIQVPVDENSQ